MIHIITKFGKDGLGPVDENIIFNIIYLSYLI